MGFECMEECYPYSWGLKIELIGSIPICHYNFGASAA
jgi:hypothetical protein